MPVSQSCARTTRGWWFASMRSILDPSILGAFPRPFAGLVLNRRNRVPEETSTQATPALIRLAALLSETPVAHEPGRSEVRTAVRAEERGSCVVHGSAP